MSESMKDSSPQWKTSAPVPSQLTEIRMAVDQLWNKATDAMEKIVKINTLLNTDLTQSRILSLIKAIMGHTSSMPDFKGENTDHDMRYTRKALLGSISEINKVNVKKAVELTISGGVVTINQSLTSIDTESDAASDDLETILGGVEGDFLLLKAENTARTVVIKHGTGNIYSNSGADFSLDSTEKIALLIYNGTNWILIT
jgi:hypothetical protein